MNNKRKETQSTPTLTPWQAADSPLLTWQSYRSYSDEEKQNVLERYFNRGEKVLQIIAETQIPKSTIYNWIRAKQRELNKQKTPVYNALTFATLQRKITRLENIVQILKSVNCTVHDPLKKRLYIAESLTDKYNVNTICEALNIAKGTYYNYTLRGKRDNVWYVKRREELRIRIKEIYDESNQIFGSPKIAAVLKSQGIRASTKIVAELMRDMGLTSIRQEPKHLYDNDTKTRRNYLNQNFDVSAPNQVWVSDITYFKVNDNQYFICAILDLYARKVIAHKIGTANSTRLVKSTIKMAYEKRMPTASLTFHTDRGSNYCSKRVFDYLKSLNIIHSYSRAHVPYDNSVMETFFSAMKREELYRRKYRSKHDFFQIVEAYIQFYNTKRPHKKLLYKTPDQKEKEFFENNGNLDN